MLAMVELQEIVAGGEFDDFFFSGQYYGLARMFCLGLLLAPYFL
jgi:hypothetical protein